MLSTAFTCFAPRVDWSWPPGHPIPVAQRCRLVNAFLLTLVTLIFCLFGRKLAGTIVTAPMIFIALGFGFAKFGGMGEMDVSHTLHTVAEIALVLLLFLDAGKTDFASLRHWRRWPSRMLLIGLPLSVLIGTALIAPLVPAGRWRRRPWLRRSWRPPMRRLGKR